MEMWTLCKAFNKLNILKCSNKASHHNKVIKYNLQNNLNPVFPY